MIVSKIRLECDGSDCQKGVDIDVEQGLQSFRYDVLNQKETLPDGWTSKDDGDLNYRTYCSPECHIEGIEQDIKALDDQYQVCLKKHNDDIEALMGQKVEL